MAPHLRLLSKAITEAVYGVSPRLIVTMPPRHGKSETVSHYAPVWYLERWPRNRVILASYEADFAATWGRKVRNTINENPDVLTVRIAGDSKASDRWSTTEGGGMMTAGVGGAITGKGANLLIVDDPIKNSAEADSERYRERTMEWWRSTAYTRLEPGAAAIVVQTRWHEEDLAGQLISESRIGGENWKVVNLPALAESEDPIGRQQGEALWPARYDVSALERIKIGSGARVWASLYQQRPSPAEGGIIKRAWWRFWQQWPLQFDEIVQSWDLTFGNSKGSDFVVGQIWGRLGANKYLLDQVRGRWDFPETMAEFEKLSAKWPNAMAKYVEEAANGKALISSLRNKIPGIIAVQPKRAKEVRAHAVTPQIEAGNIFLPDPQGCMWTEEFIEECAAFPNGAHDDQVDAMSQALNEFAARDDDQFFIETPDEDAVGISAY